MAKAWLVTHPETQMDQDGKVHGKLDPPLSNKGKHRAELIAHSFKGKGVKKIHSSPRVRARQMADAMSKYTGAPVEVHDDLIPWDLGNLSGAKVSAMKPLLDHFSKHSNKPVPSGESKDAVLGRYRRFMKKVKPGDAIVGHSQHSLALQHVQKGGDASKVPMFGGKAGEVKEIDV